MTLSRRSSIEGHPDRDRIIEAIANGMSGAEIARRWSLSESAVSRWRSSARSNLTQLLSEDGNDPTEILGRLADLADSARVTRKLADTSSSPQVRARAITAELAVLDRLTKLAIDDTAAARLAQAAGPMVKVIQKLSRSYPREVLAALAEHAELRELVDALRVQIGSRK